MPNPDPPLLMLGDVALTLYRGPSDYNSPKMNERTIEVALGLWFLRRQLRRQVVFSGSDSRPLIEVGNVMAQYWPPSDRLNGRVIPWTIVDLVDTGVDAGDVSFVNTSVLSLSTVEHIGYDNEGLRHSAGRRADQSALGLERWVAGWDDAATLAARMTEEASDFLISFPIGFNPRLDEVVRTTPALRRFARVLRRVDAANSWEEDRSGSFDYRYDFRDTYDLASVGHMYHPALPDAYRSVYGEPMPDVRPPPWHPPFRFANAVCVLTNAAELLS